MRGSGRQPGGGGHPLLRLDPIGDGEAEAGEDPAASAVELDLPAAPEQVPVLERTRRGQEDLRGLLLGFDVDPHDDRRVLDDYLLARQAATEDGHRPLAEELDLLNVFADLAELSRNRPTGEDGGSAHVHSDREYFHTYLQSLDVERAGLPATFQAKLARALGHYGVTELDRCAEVEAAVFRIFLAQQRATADAAVVTALLRAWLPEPPPEEALREPVGLALERLLAATQVRFPVIADLARGWSSPGSPSRCCAATGPGSTPRSASTCATWMPSRTPRTGPSGWPRWYAAPNPWSGC